MNKVTLTINIPADQLKAIAMSELGLTDAAAKPADTGLPGVAANRRPDAVRMAIDHVIRATAKFDSDQYSNGYASAATALFEAGKRLRAGGAEETKTTSAKGTFHV